MIVSFFLTMPRITRQRFRAQMIPLVLRALKEMCADAMDLGDMGYLLYLLTKKKNYEPFVAHHSESYFQEWVRTMEDDAYRALDKRENDTPRSVTRRRRRRRRCRDDA